MRITESKLRKIIRSIIAEGHDFSLLDIPDYDDPIDYNKDLKRRPIDFFVGRAQVYWHACCKDKIAISKEDFVKKCKEKCKQHNISFADLSKHNLDRALKEIQKCCDEAFKELS